MNSPTRDNFRKLRFESIDDCIAEVHSILQAEQQGQLRTSGNWTAGQNLAHLAAWINYAYDGFPIGPPPFFIRWFLRLGLRSMLEKGMSRGVKIPGVPGGTTGMEEIATAEAGQRFLKALDRLRSDEQPRYDSPAFGKLSDEDRVKLNLRHAELHLGNLYYEPTTNQSE